ncbi:MAG TPA: hypothetical protein VGP99_04185 [Tepidisphaeraceae bacterium]|jgi:hypothetical protein|nr:hypothetical protein [Tepidisphaeraceae bacterium]
MILLPSLKNFVPLRALRGQKFRALGGSPILVLLSALLISADAPTNYHQDFQKSDEGSMPEELLVMNGKFEVVKQGEEKFLELPGEPLDTFGFMLGADQTNSIQASIRSTNTGKRFPEFGVGLAGAAGYRLWLQPAVGELQILKGDNVKATKPCEWKSNSWLTLRLELKKQNNKTTLQGKIWPRGTAEPQDWTITFEDSETEKPPKGRASVWGIPYSGTPIDFDDIAIAK